MNKFIDVIENKYDKIDKTFVDYCKIKESYIQYQNRESIDILFAEREQAHEEFLCVIHMFSLFLPKWITKIIENKMLGRLFK